MLINHPLTALRALTQTARHTLSSRHMMPRWMTPRAVIERQHAVEFSHRLKPTRSGFEQILPCAPRNRTSAPATYPPKKLEAADKTVTVRPPQPIKTARLQQTADFCRTTASGLRCAGAVTGFATGGVTACLAGAAHLTLRLDRDHATQKRSFSTTCRGGFRAGYAMGKAPWILMSWPLELTAWGAARLG